MRELAIIYNEATEKLEGVNSQQGMMMLSRNLF